MSVFQKTHSCRCDEYNCADLHQVFRALTLGFCQRESRLQLRSPWQQQKLESTHSGMPELTSFARKASSRTSTPGRTNRRSQTAEAQLDQPPSSHGNGSRSERSVSMMGEHKQRRRSSVGAATNGRERARRRCTMNAANGRRMISRMTLTGIGLDFYMY